MNIVCGYSVENFVSDDKPMVSVDTLPFGIAMIATVLKQAGHDVRTLVVTPVSRLEERVRSMMRAHCPQLLCLTSVSTQYPLIRKVAACVKSMDPSIPVIVGGVHASLNPEDVISDEAVDAICIGEGERAIVEYVRQLEEGLHPSGVPNLWIKQPGGGEIDKSPTAPFWADLDELPVIDRSLWEPWMAGPLQKQSILIGRGCPNRCTYCSNHALRKLAGGRYVRFRSPANIAKEIELLAGRYPELQEIYLEVETIGANLNYAGALCEELERYNSSRATPIVFGINLALTRRYGQDEEFARSLLECFRRANIRSINVGLESGSERIRSEVLQRPVYTNEDMIRFTGWARESGIKVYLYVMIGLPGESAADLKQTIEICRVCRPAYLLLSIFFPYPGTDLYVKAGEMGLLPAASESFGRERSMAYGKGGEVSRFYLMFVYITFYYRVFRKRWGLTALLGVTIRQLFSINSSALARLRRSPALHRMRKMVLGKTL